MVPEPNDAPKPDDELDGERYDDEPEPGTLYSGRTTDGWTARSC
jgi:hypothetical protein